MGLEKMLKQVKGKKTKAHLIGGRWMRCAYLRKHICERSQTTLVSLEEQMLYLEHWVAGDKEAVWSVDCLTTLGKFEIVYI